MPSKQIDTKPAYYRGQLLLEDDFIAEQRYHSNARCRHSLDVHGWGVVRGLGVSPGGDAVVLVGPGYAIDPGGQEIELTEQVSVDLSALPPGGELAITLRYEEESLSDGREPRRQLACHAVIEALPATSAAPGLVLATLRLDDKSRLVAGSLDTSRVRYVRVVPGPGTVTAEALDPGLRKGWLRLPFRPVHLERGAKGEDVIPPPFRVGATECRSYDEYAGKKNDQGAGGTMAVPIPPGARTLHRFRIAGEENSGKLELKLVVGGWDHAQQKHFRKLLVDETIEIRPYERTYDISDQAIDPEYHTLSIWIRGYGKTSVSFVAVEISC